MRGSGGILVTGEGNRFANELATRAVLTEAVFKFGTPMSGDGDDGEEKSSEGAAAPTVAYLLLDQEAADKFGTGVLGFYMSEFTFSSLSSFFPTFFFSCSSSCSWSSSARSFISDFLFQCPFFFVV